MKWLTRKYIKECSETLEGALKVSYEHWCQLYSATQEELRKGFDKNEIYVDQSDCGLCMRYFIECKGCPLRTCEPETSLYRKARYALSDWLDGDGEWKDWKRKSKAVRDRLKKLIKH